MFIVGHTYEFKDDYARDCFTKAVAINESIVAALGEKPFLVAGTTDSGDVFKIQTADSKYVEADVDNFRSCYTLLSALEVYYFKDITWDSNPVNEEVKEEVKEAEKVKILVVMDNEILYSADSMEHAEALAAPYKQQYPNSVVEIYSLARTAKLSVSFE